jgi:hypothetical protein
MDGMAAFNLRIAMGGTLTRRRVNAFTIYSVLVIEKHKMRY